MGGVDICDQQMEYYRTWIKTKKWTLKVILHFLDLATVNAWMEYRQDCNKAGIPNGKVKDLLHFRMDLSETLLATPKRKRTANEEIVDDEAEETKRPQNYRAALPCTDKRLDGYDHWPEVDDLPTARFCRRSGCKSRTRTRCTKCDVYLCLTKTQNCFREFHRKF